MEIETSNLVGRLTVASASPWVDGKQPLKGATLGHVNHLNFAGHQPSVWNG